MSVLYGNPELQSVSQQYNSRCEGNCFRIVQIHGKHIAYRVHSRSGSRSDGGAIAVWARPPQPMQYKLLIFAGHAHVMSYLVEVRQACYLQLKVVISRTFLHALHGVGRFWEGFCEARVARRARRSLRSGTSRGRTPPPGARG